MPRFSDRGAVLDQVKQVADGFKGIVDLVHHRGRKLATHRKALCVAQRLIGANLTVCHIAHFNLLEPGTESYLYGTEQ